MTCCGLLLRAVYLLFVWFVWGLPWEVGAAGCFTIMLGNDDSWQLCALPRRVGGLALRVRLHHIWLPFLYIQFFRLN